MRIEWSPAARASARRYMDDQDGMHATGRAVVALALDPYPPAGFHRGEYHRLRVSRFRVVYVVEDDYPYPERLSREEYEHAKRLLQVELLKLQYWMQDSGRRFVAHSVAPLPTAVAASAYPRRAIESADRTCGLSVRDPG